MTLLPQVRSQLDSAAHRQATRTGRARSARIANATLPRRFPSLSGVITTIAVIVALGIAGGTIALLSHHNTATKPVSRPTPSTSTALPTPIHRLQGRRIVIIVWATWCQPCRTELSLAATIAPHYGHKVAFIASDYLDGGSPEPICASTTSHWRTTRPQICTRWSCAHVPGVPVTIFVNAEGLRHPNPNRPIPLRVSP